MSWICFIKQIIDVDYFDDAFTMSTYLSSERHDWTRNSSLTKRTLCNMAYLVCPSTEPRLIYLCNFSKLISRTWELPNGCRPPKSECRPSNPGLFQPWWTRIRIVKPYWIRIVKWQVLREIRLRLHPGYHQWNAPLTVTSCSFRTAALWGLKVWMGTSFSWAAGTWWLPDNSNCFLLVEGDWWQKYMSTTVAPSASCLKS